MNILSFCFCNSEMEVEINGLVLYNLEVIKFDEARLSNGITTYKPV